MRFNLTLYLTAFVATTGIVAMPIPDAKPINPNTVSDVGNGMKEATWKKALKPWLKRIALLGFMHQLMSKGYPWVLDFIHDQVSDGYDEEWLAQFDFKEDEAPVIAENDSEDSEEELPGGEVTF